MNGDYASFNSLHAQYRKDVCEAVARLLNTAPIYVEK